MTKASYLMLLGLFIFSIHAKGEIDGVPHLPKMSVQIMEGSTSAYPNPFNENTTIFYSAR